MQQLRLLTGHLVIIAAYWSTAQIKLISHDEESNVYRQVHSKLYFAAGLLLPFKCAWARSGPSEGPVPEVQGIRAMSAFYQSIKLASACPNFPLLSAHQASLDEAWCMALTGTHLESYANPHSSMPEPAAVPQKMLLTSWYHAHAVFMQPCSQLYTSPEQEC